MKLYIWNNPYHPPYGGSLLFVVAENLKDARAQAANSLVAPFGDPWEKRTLGKMDLGEPTRVISQFPYGECYEWSE